MWVHSCHGTHAEVRGQLTGVNSLSFTMWVPGIELSSIGLEPGAFTHVPFHWPCFYITPNSPSFLLRLFSLTPHGFSDFPTIQIPFLLLLCFVLILLPRSISSHSVHLL